MNAGPIVYSQKIHDIIGSNILGRCAAAPRARLLAEQKMSFTLPKKVLGGSYRHEQVLAFPWGNLALELIQFRVLYTFIEQTEVFSYYIAKRLIFR